MSGTELVGDRVRLRPIGAHDVPDLVAIRESRSIRRWWGPAEEPGWPLDDSDTEARGVWHDGQVVGFVQWYEHADPRYRHAGIDLFIAEPAQGVRPSRWWSTISCMTGGITAS